MNRRSFLQESVKTAAAVASVPVLPKASHALLLPRLKTAGSWALESGVALNGELYDAEVPDTLDLSDRARLAINGLTRGVDAEHDYEHYFLTLYMKDPPEMWHTGSGDMSCCNPKWSESLPMMRIRKRVGVGHEGLPWTPDMQQRELKTVAPEKPETKDVIPRTLQGGCCSGNGTQAMYYALAQHGSLQGRSCHRQLVAQPRVSVDGCKQLPAVRRKSCSQKQAGSPCSRSDSTLGGQRRDPNASEW